MAIIGYGEQRSLLETGDFRKKVYQAIIKAAVAIRNEDPNTDHHQSRVSLANAVVINPFSLLKLELLFYNCCRKLGKEWQGSFS